MVIVDYLESAFCCRKPPVCKFSYMFYSSVFANITETTLHTIHKLQLDFTDEQLLRKVCVEELGGPTIVVFRNESTYARISTIVSCGATDNFIGDMERVVYDGANTCLTCDGYYVPSTATSEMNLTSELAVHVDTLPRLEQYAVRRCMRNTYTSKSSRFKSTITDKFLISA
ncbi:T-complex protein 1 subunit theta-like [Anastrepha obliqua]|uniref:T-complex protein 1 subunit theta-like n=1 Tax=Anastrepha obliqua TaxID=95512 RepID=UPI002409F127|nr:T-complex protein 1 subunit theta-like [Anastrepha obliqua]